MLPQRRESKAIFDSNYQEFEVLYKEELKEKRFFMKIQRPSKQSNKQLFSRHTFIGRPYNVSNVQ